MKRARGAGLARPARLRVDVFWRDEGWGIDYASGERTGDGRAEVWDDFCHGAKTGGLTGQRCRLTPGFKAAAARVLQAFWQRKAPAELSFFPDEPADDNALRRATGDLYTYSMMLQAAALHVLGAAAFEVGLRAVNVPAYGSCAIHACAAPEDGAPLWRMRAGEAGVLVVEEEGQRLLALRAADTEWLRTNLAHRLPDGRSVETHLLEAACAELQLSGRERPAAMAYISRAQACDGGAAGEAVGEARASTDDGTAEDEAALRTAALNEYLTELAASPTRVWYTPVALVARGAALGANVCVLELRDDLLERLPLTPRPADDDSRPVRYVGWLEGPGMPSHFVRLERQADLHSDVAEMLP
mmetsp:Transcript_22408/g.72000  ORF Transcript_22408/g.72000 Transcript_22408/m.72000 type:complete len:358 (+) Transcript_22408:58-1131(+)